jgi:hypothetical protein
MIETAPATKFQFVGGDLSLDFCNTMGGKRGGMELDDPLDPMVYFISGNSGILGTP